MPITTGLFPKSLTGVPKAPKVKKPRIPKVGGGGLPKPKVGGGAGAKGLKVGKTSKNGKTWSEKLQKQLESNL